MSALECYCGTPLNLTLGEQVCESCKRPHVIDALVGTMADPDAARKALEAYGADLLEDLDKQHNAIIEHFGQPLPELCQERAYTYGARAGRGPGR